MASISRLSSVVLLFQKNNLRYSANDYVKALLVNRAYLWRVETAMVAMHCDECRDRSAVARWLAVRSRMSDATRITAGNASLGVYLLPWLL
jgi:hypothetical protein